MTKELEIRFKTLKSGDKEVIKAYAEKLGMKCSDLARTLVYQKVFSENEVKTNPKN